MTECDRTKCDHSCMGTEAEFRQRMEEAKAALEGGEDHMLAYVLGTDLATLHRISGKDYRPMETEEDEG